MARRLWSANFLKTASTVDVRADLGYEIVSAVDLLSNTSLPIHEFASVDHDGKDRVGVTKPSSTQSLGVTLTLEPLEWRVLAVQRAKSPA